MHGPHTESSGAPSVSQPHAGADALPGYALAPGYVAPQLGPGPGPGPWLPPEPRSLRGLGTLTVVLLGCQCFVGLLAAGVAGWGAVSWARVAGAPADLRLAADDAAARLVGVTWPLTLVTAVLFIWWLYVAASNAERVGARLRQRPGWAIAGWLVPFLGLWRPKQLVDDVWRASMPGVPRGIDLAFVRKPGVVTGWWAVWLMAGSLPAFGITRAVLLALGPTFPAIQDGVAPSVQPDWAGLHESLALWSLWAAVLLVIAAGLAIQIVVRITAWQQEWATPDP